MEPYYKTDLGKLYCGDCLEVMPELEPVDLVLTDPPYGIGEAAGKNKSRCKLAVATDYGNHCWDNSIPKPEYFNTIFAISKNQIIFGGNYFGLPASPCWIVWDKDNSGDFADCELAWTSFRSAVRKFTWRWNGMLQQDMKNKEIRVHPTQKPVPLFSWILTKYSIQNDLVCDPFIGSGTTAVACEKLGRKWVGIELSEEYCEIAAKRIEQEAKQLKLF